MAPGAKEVPRVVHKSCSMTSSCLSDYIRQYFLFNNFSLNAHLFIATNKAVLCTDICHAKI